MKTMTGKRERRLVVNCNGGLGNQMFQYAAGLYFSRKLNRKLELAKPRVARQQWNGYSRPFQLDQFRIQAPVRELDGRERLFLSGQRLVRTLKGGLRSMMNVEVLEEPRTYHYYPAMAQDTNAADTYLDGYWQAAGYVEGVSNELRKHFTLTAPLQARNRAYAEMIREFKCPVSVHLRIGDYSLISHPTGNGNNRVSQILPVAYYRRALAAVEDALDEVTPIVFSDETEQAKRVFSGVARCIFIEGNDTAHAHEDLMLMSMCRHHVIANSSFSWWGAWLNAKADKRVFAPRYWGNTADSYFPDLYPAGWETIDNLAGAEDLAVGRHAIAQPWSLQSSESGGAQIQG